MCFPLMFNVEDRNGEHNKTVQLRTVVNFSTEVSGSIEFFASSGGCHSHSEPLVEWLQEMKSELRIRCQVTGGKKYDIYIKVRETDSANMERLGNIRTVLSQRAYFLQNPQIFPCKNPRLFRMLFSTPFAYCSSNNSDNINSDGLDLQCTTNPQVKCTKR